MRKNTKINSVNLDTKSQLAKLIATENIIVQHNNVKTASFNTETRVLTLPIFKEQKGDVYDMLIAHECAHALWTPQDGWKKICDDEELRTYVNVLEDTRIDRLIQKKYPGVVKNYINGFDILEKQNFFGMHGKDLNKSLMLIDKINLRSKSSNRLPFIFSPDNNKWLDKVDSLKTFKDVVNLAKEMLDWQKKQVEELKKLPDFDMHPIISNYDLSDEDGDSDDAMELPDDIDDNSDEQDEKNDKRDSEDSDDKKDEDKKDDSDTGKSDTDTEDKKDDTEDKKEATQHAKGAGGEPVVKKLKAITNEAFEQKKEELLDQKTSYTYGTFPDPNLDSCLTSYKEWLNDWRLHINRHLKDYPEGTKQYREWILNKFKKFRSENKKTVMYLVKEFEMKKAATAYKRAATNKTGIIDPLKLKNYKFSEDIFKKMTIIPDGKNHGMIMLLDWSGSMSDCLQNTVEQLINLIDFVKRVNIPFEVYFFTSERRLEEKEKHFYNYKVDDFAFDKFKLVNIASHRMNKKELEESLLHLYHSSMGYDYRYGYRRSDIDYPQGTNYYMPDQYHLGNTPLNEGLLVVNKLIPIFQKKYKVEKLTFITLTDGGANSFRHNQIKDVSELTDEYEIADHKKQKNKFYLKNIGYDDKLVINYKKKRYIIKDWYGDSMTNTLLDMIKYNHNATVVGFYVIKRLRRWDMDRYIGDYKDYADKEMKVAKLRKEFTKNKSCLIDKTGYDKYFLLDGKSMNVQNFNLNDAAVKKGTKGELKRIFGKSMKNRLVSRVVLNKFIQEVA
tara:strand:- start:539 stop:2887 length:2349 start_codon:yes stop_codon:yes gene_type:complete